MSEKEPADSTIRDKSSDLNEAQKLSDIHYQIEHLLYVLKRNTYFGDDIIKRVKYFIKVLLEKLSLPGDLLSQMYGTV